MEARTIKEYAYAKINLYLDVLSKREDGFHEIESIMQTVSLADELTFTMTPDKEHSVNLRIEGNDTLENDESNLVLRAVRAYEEYLPIRGRLDILLKKRIPTAAGLGGGSADAAATLRALNKLAKDPIDDIELFDIARNLGSDVPFCLRGGTHLCCGKGDLISPTRAIKNLHLVIVNSGERVSTPVAYADLDRIYNDFAEKREDSVRAAALYAIEKGKTDTLYNVFEDVVLKKCPKAKNAREKLISLGAISALMSGSGSSIFGVFDSKKQAENAVSVLEEEFPFVSCAEEKGAYL